MLVKDRYSLDFISNRLIAISHDHPKRLMVFVGDHNKMVLKLLE